MSLSDSPGSQLGPLNPGDVVSAAIRLYRDRFKTYLKISALATLWIFAGIVGLAIVVGIFVGIFGAIGGETMAILGGFLGAVIGLVPLLYGAAKYYMLSSVIGRLSFGDLVNQPETSLDVRRDLNPKLGQFLFLGFLLFLAYIAAYIVVALAALLVGFGTGLVVGGIFGALINATVGGIVGGVLGFIFGAAVFIIGLIWILSRLFIPEVIMAIEPNQDAGTSMSRSWELTQTSIGRIQLIFLATFLIQLPIISITNYLPSMFLAFLPTTPTFLVISQGFSLLFSLVASIAVLPLWQAVKGVLYYDLRSRREGLDLELRY